MRRAYHLNLPRFLIHPHVDYWPCDRLLKFPIVLYLEPSPIKSLMVLKVGHSHIKFQIVLSIGPFSYQVPHSSQVRGPSSPIKSLTVLEIGPSHIKFPIVLEIGPSSIKSTIVLKIGPPMDLRYGAGLMDFRVSRWVSL